MKQGSFVSGGAWQIPTHSADALDREPICGLSHGWGDVVLRSISGCRAMEQINVHRAEALQRRVQAEVVAIAAAAFASILDHVNGISEVTNDLLIVRTL